MYEKIIDKIRLNFLSIKNSEKKKYIYMNNAFLSHKPNNVIKSQINYYINKIFYIKKNSFINKFGFNINKNIEDVRKKISILINSNIEEIIFTSNTTNSINIISNIIKKNLKKDDNIIISISNHNSNILPWIKLSKKKKIKIKFIKIDKNGNLTINEIINNIDKKTKFISINHISNVLGIINPIENIIKLSKLKNKNLLFMVDGTQFIMHNKLNVKKMECDFYVFSSSKMFGPEGVGILYINKNININIKKIIPWEFEKGTLNYSGIIGLGESINFINKIGIKLINKILLYNTKYFLNLIKENINNSIIYYSSNNSRIGIIPFNIKKINSYDIGKILEYKNIFIRFDSQCSLYLMKFLNIKSLCRISISIYNNKKEMNNFIDIMNKIIHILKK